MKTQLPLTNRATHLCNTQWRGRPLNTYRYAPPVRVHHAEFVSFTSKGVNITRRGMERSGWPQEIRPSPHVLPGGIEDNPKNGERWGSVPSWDERRGWPHRNTPLPHMSYIAECGHSALKDVGTNGGESQKWRALGAPPPWDGRRNTDP